MSTEANRTVGIIGAGIVGLCCAHYLQKAGFSVTLIDKGEPGRACSYGNAGILTATECGPLGLPGMMRSLPKWLMDPLGPMAVKPSYLPTLIPWGLRLLKESQQERVQQIADRMQAFYSSSVDLYSELLGSIGASDLLRKNGYLCVYRDRAAAKPDDYFWDLHRQRGIELQDLGSSEIRQMVPALAKDITHAIYVTQEGRVLNPYGVSKAILENFLGNGGQVVQETVSGLASDGNTVPVTTETGTRQYGSVVVAAGIQSKEMAKKLGYKVLLEAMRGYHAMLPAPAIDLRLPVMSGEYKFFASPMQEGLRLAGTAEFADHRTPPNYKRADALVSAARLLFPDIETGSYDRWMGNRPMTPDSLPVVGQAPNHRNIFFAFGHGHNGLSGAPMTGRLITDLISGDGPSVDPAPLSIERFQ